MTKPEFVRFDGQPWAPTAFTPPLSDGVFPSAGPRLVQLLERHHRIDKGARSGRRVRLDDWQRALFTHILELYPRDWPDRTLAGRLRFRQCVASMGRQNGKSLIGAGLGEFGLLQHVPNPNVIGIATKIEAANLVYDRVKYAIDHDPDLRARLKATGTRGISHRRGAGSYSVRPAGADGVQSDPVTLGIVDELHLLAEIMWDSMVTGQRAQPDALVVGITTAGDASSTLLKRLYERGHGAIMDPDSDPRFGFWLWQAPDGAALDRDADIMAANPAVASGRISIADVRTDSIGKPVDEIMRYTFNRFVDSVDPWVPLDGWNDGRTTERPGLGDLATLTFGVARTATWSNATITAASTTSTGLWTEVVHTRTGASLPTMLTACRALAERWPSAMWALEASQLADLGKALREDGRTVYLLTGNEMSAASAGLYSAVTRRAINHPGDDLLTAQLPTVRRTGGGSGAWRLVPGIGDADSVMATASACYIAETKQPAAAQLF